MNNFPYRFKKNPLINYSGVTRSMDRLNELLYGEDPFDGEELAQKLTTYVNSEYYQIPPSTILKYWSLTADFGDIHHEDIEKYIKHNKECQFSQFLNENGISYETSFSEVYIADDELRLHGFVDIIQKRYNLKTGKMEYIIHDIKTFKKMTPDKLKKASLQILLYCVMLNRTLPEGETARPGKILHIGNVSKPDNLDVTTWELDIPKALSFDRNAMEDGKRYITQLKTEAQKNKERLVIGISGKKGSGKDLFMKKLSERLEDRKFELKKIADPVKIISATLSNLPLEYFYNHYYYDRKIKSLDENVRTLQQKVGTDLFRNFYGEDVWVNIMRDKIIKSDDNIIITDIRFENEVSLVKEFPNSYVIRIDIDAEDDESSNHLSETALDDCECDWDYRFYNDKKTMSDFEENVEKFIKNMEISNG